MQVSTVSRLNNDQPWPEPWDRLLIFRMIEILSLWEGRLTSNEIMKAFGIGRQQASKVINIYKKLHPENLNYDPSLKCHHATTQFAPKYTAGVANEYLQQIATRNELTSCFATLGLELANAELIQSPIRNIKPTVLRPIVQAARSKQRLEIEYVSMTTPVSEGRIIAPHTIVWSGFRWHVRAYCEKNQDFRDFVLSRIVDTPEITLESKFGSEADTAWNTIVSVIITPDVRLTRDQRRVIENDYGMHRGKLTIQTRGALVQYLLQTLRIDPHVVQTDPTAQQIAIKNLHNLQEWLF